MTRAGKAWYILPGSGRRQAEKLQVCRLLSNFVKYFSVIGFLYYCLALFGIDTATLLASAGILTLVVGIGAQTLVSVPPRLRTAARISRSSATAM